MNAIRWGFVGTGTICRKVGRAMQALAAKTTEGPVPILAAVGSRTPGAAAGFAAEFGLSAAKAYGSYESLFADPEIDAVYIGTPHPAHFGNALAALRAGKAVLCEKPVAMNARETRLMAEEARKRGRFFMEAMWTRFLPVTRRVQEWIAAGEIGEVRLVQAHFGFPIERTPANVAGRLLNKALGGGALLDLGIYPVSYAALLLGTAPEALRSAAHLGATGVDENASLLLHYPGGRQAVLSCSIDTRLEAAATVFGTKGRIEIPWFFAAQEATLHVADKEPLRFEDKFAHGDAGYEYQIAEACRRIAAGEVESPGMSHADSVAIIEILDAARAEWGLRYEADALGATGR